MIEILMKILAKITIIRIENREPYYFIIIYKRKEVRLSVFSYQMLASTFDSDERSSNYEVYGCMTIYPLGEERVGLVSTTVTHEDE